MAIGMHETLPSPSSPSSSSHSSCRPFRHFYVAVDRLQFKMDTLVDLLGVASKRSSLPIVICCSSRDELDLVCSNVSNLSFVSLSPLVNWKCHINRQFSDQTEVERASILEKFRQSTAKWSQITNLDPEERTEAESPQDKSALIVVTDACLPSVIPGESSICARVLINYELPSKKETYFRRMSTCLAPDGIVINMVVGGEVVTLKSIEDSSGLLIAEMPINISEIL